MAGGWSSEINATSGKLMALVGVMLKLGRNGAVWVADSETMHRPQVAQLWVL